VSPQIKVYLFKLIVMNCFVRITTFIVAIIFSFNVYGQWNQLGPSFLGVEGSRQGSAVSFNQNATIVAIGAYSYDGGLSSGNYGRVSIYQYIYDQWQLIGLPIQGDYDDRYGYTVDLSDDGYTVAIGIKIDDGDAYVYHFEFGNWTMVGSKINDTYGQGNDGSIVSLNLDGSIVAIGAPGHYGAGSNSGHVKVYEFDGIDWIQIGQTLEGENNQDYFGTSVEINDVGNRIVVGAPWNADNGNQAGKVQVFEYSTSMWNQLGSDILGDAVTNDAGRSVSMNAAGDIIAIGEEGNDSIDLNMGKVRVFEFNGTDWVQMGPSIFSSGSGHFGSCVDLSADGYKIAVSSVLDTSTIDAPGYVEIFEFTGSSWNSISQVFEGDSLNDYLGDDIDLSDDGESIIIGAPNNNTADPYAGLVKVYSTSSVGLEAYSKNEPYRIYPTVVSDKLIVEMLNQKYSNSNYCIIDVNGKIVNKGVLKNAIEELDLSSLKSGLYMLQLSKDGVIHSSKFVKS